MVLLNTVIMQQKVGDGKSYIDRELVIKVYQQTQNQNEVAKTLNIHPDSVGQILKENNIKVLTGQEVIKNKNGHPVMAIDIKTKNIIKVFSDQSDAARWIMKIGKTCIKDTHKVSYIIGRAARGLRKTAYGYVWKQVV